VSQQFNDIIEISYTVQRNAGFAIINYAKYYSSGRRVVVLSVLVVRHSHGMWIVWVLL
jgi:hypothetical protein